MRARILFGVVFVVLLGVRAAFPQAAAESVLLNSNSAAATSKAGSVLGNALNKAGGNLAAKIQTVPKSTATSGTIQHAQAPKTRSAAPATPTVSASAGGSSASGSMITSIQGARTNRAPAPASSSSGANASKTADRPTPKAPPDSSAAPK